MFDVIAFILGIIVGVLINEFRKKDCEHEWSQWEPTSATIHHGVFGSTPTTLLVRKCMKCGDIQKKEIH